jgi:hypothetical protein
VNNETEKHLEESGSGLIFRYYPGISLEGLRKTTKNLNEDSRSPGRNLNLKSPEYEEVLTTQTRRLVINL